MKTTQTNILLALAALLGVGGWAAISMSHPKADAGVPPRLVAVTASNEKLAATPVAKPEAAVAPLPGAAAVASMSESSPALAARRMDQSVSLPAASAKAQGPAVVAQAGKKPARKPRKGVKDPQARAALSGVGVDPKAEGYWITAINDPALPANERHDLIEDLNEDGFADPDHPTKDDVPMIMNRLALIQELAPESMDQVNSEAFQEAYKDLVKMLADAK